MKKIGPALAFVSAWAFLLASCAKDDKAPAAPTVAPVATSTPTACPTVLPGGVQMADASTAHNTNTIHAFPVTLSAAGSINRVRLRMTNDGVTGASVALYTNTASGQPGIRLAQGVFRTMDTVTATVFNIQSPLLAPDIYWIAFLFTGSQPELQTVTGSTRRFYSSGPHAELPAVMPTGSVYTSFVSIYTYVCD